MIFLGMIAIVAVSFIARSRAFQAVLLGRIVQRAQQATGVAVAIRNMKLAWNPLVADFYGVTLGSQSGLGRPVFTVDHVRVGLKLMPLLRHRVDLSEIVVDHPTLYVHVDAKGNSNLPTMKESRSSPNSIAVAIRHVSIQNGTLNYNDQRIPLDAELQDFRLEADAEPLSGGYKGSLAYDHGVISAMDLNRLEHKAQIDFEAGGEGLELQRVAIFSGDSQIDFTGSLTDFQNPRLDGQYTAVINASQLGRILKDPSIPAGKVSLKGNLAYKNVPGETFLHSLEVGGQIWSNNLNVRGEQVQAHVTSVDGAYRIADANLEIQSLDAALLGGRAEAHGQISLDSTRVSQLEAVVRGASLDQISSSTVPARQRDNLRLVGRADARAQVRWDQSFRDAILKAHVLLAYPERTTTTARDIPVDGSIDLTYDRGKNTISFLPSHLRTGKTNLALSGTASDNSSLNVAGETTDLRELNALISSVNAKDKNETNRTYDLGGAAKFSGQISGSLGAPRIRGRFFSSALQIQGSNWKTLRADLDASPSGIRAQNGFLQSANGGQVNFDVRASLENWSFLPAGPLALHANWKELEAVDIAHLANANYPVTGLLAGNLSIDGSLQHPSGHGTLDLTDASIWNQPVKSVTVDFQGDRDAIRSSMRINLPVGTASAHVDYSPATQHYDFVLDAGSLGLNQIQVLQEHAASVNGLLSIKAKGEGTIAQPQLQANLDLSQLQLGDQSLSPLHAQLQVAEQRAHFHVTSTAAQAPVQAKGDISLSGDYPVEANMEMHSAPIAALLATYLPKVQKGLDGSLDLQGSVHGPLKSPGQLQASVEVPSVKLGYKGLQIANEGPLRFDYRDATVIVRQARLKGTGTDFSVQGTIPFDRGTSMNVSVNGVVDTSLMQIVSPETHSSGQVRIDLHAEGQTTDPVMKGQIQIVNAAVSSESLPVSLSAVNGLMQISGNRIQVESLRGTAGGGTISASGSFSIASAPNFALSLQAKSIRIHPEGMHTTLDGDLNLNGTAENANLTGRIVVDHLSFQQGSDLSTIISNFSGTPAASTPSAFASHTKLNIAVQSSDELSVSNSQFSISGTTSLTVTNTFASPVILGRISLTGGDVFFLGKRFELQNGSVLFSNPVETEPVLNLYVTTTVEQYKITVNLLGPVDRLKTNYTSDPALAPLDIINLLAFGQTTAEQASNAATPASLGAESVIAQGVGGQVAKGVQGLTGISQLTLDPMGGTAQNPADQLGIQERVTGNVLFTFSTNVTTTQNQTVQVEYQPKRNVTVSVIRDEYGGYGIDVKLHKTF